MPCDDWTPAEDAVRATLPLAQVQKRTRRSMPSIIARRVRLKKQGVPMRAERAMATEVVARVDAEMARAQAAMADVNTTP